MLGGVWDASGDWRVPDFSAEFWAHADAANHPNKLLGDWAYRGDTDDPVTPGQTLQEKLDGIDDIDMRREALRALRGRKLRSEAYALDGSARQDKPFVVTEALHSFRDLTGEAMSGGALSGQAHGIFFAYSVAKRTTNWDRGDDPATTFSWSEDYDAYGQPRKSTSIACPRGFGRTDVQPAEPFLSTHGTTSFIHVDQTDQYMVDRTAETFAYQVEDADFTRPEGPLTLEEFKDSLDKDNAFKITKTTQGHAITYYDGAAFVGLSKGQIGTYGAAVRSEKLVMTDDILAEAYPTAEGGPPAYLAADSPSWPAEYPADFTSRIDALSGRAGYRYDSATGYFYAESTRTKYDFQGTGSARGLVVETKNPADHVVSITYGQYDLLPTQVDNTIAGTTLTRQATYDYRIFKPVEVTDVNDNRVQLAYTPLGLVDKQAVLNASGAALTLGDTMTDPGTRFVYDLSDYEVSHSPMSVRTIKRVQHVNNAQPTTPADLDDTIESIQYSDGFGRVIQSRAQAEDLDFGNAGLGSPLGPATGQTVTGQRVRVSGWQRYNNKGKVVQKWEPFFAEDWDFYDVAQNPNGPAGQSIELYYDARGRQYKTVHPNGAQELVVFGVPGTINTPDLSTPGTYEPTPWERYTYDANDNGGRTDVADIDEQIFEAHWDTPASVVFDALGRVVSATVRNGTDPGDAYTTTTTYDIRGSVLEVHDPVHTAPAATQVYDLANRVLRSESIDAGTSTAAFDAAGVPIEARDARGGLALKNVDEMLRPTKSWGRDATGDPVRLVDMTVYGDTAGLSSAKDDNLLGKPWRHYDEAGRLEFSHYDFKGNLVIKTRRVIDPGLMISAYDDADAGNNWVVDTYRVDWTLDTQNGESLAEREAWLLDATDYTVITGFALPSPPPDYVTAFDALGRPRQVYYPRDTENEQKLLIPTYNRAGALKSVELAGDTYVEHIAYNPKGQRILAALGNGVMTRYAYDQKTFRLTRLRSEAWTHPTGEPNTYQATGATKVQDITYTYDAVGNITSTGHDGDQVGVGGTSSLTRDFAYDPLYRLISATGREYAANPAKPWEYMPNGGNANDPTQTRAYTETYTYDAVGSLTQLVHNYGGTQQWTRDYTVESTSNQLTSMTSAGTTRTYTYDASGNLLDENTERHHEWDWAGRMRAFRNQVAGSQATVFAHYTYDSSGQRVQKVVSKSGANPVHTVYIDGVFEHHVELDSNGVVAENNVLHVMDDTKRVATKRLGSELDGSNPPAVQYHLGDHLQSSAVVVDGTGAFYNREEYRPYGESSFGSFAKKRYRFTGKERDEESSLYYHGARYYASWTARWTATDPMGMVDGPNLYQYVSGNPVRLVDPNGTKGQSGAVAAASNAVAAASDKADDAVRQSLEQCLSNLSCSMVEFAAPAPKISSQPKLSANHRKRSEEVTLEQYNKAREARRRQNLQALLSIAAPNLGAGAIGEIRVAGDHEMGMDERNRYIAFMGGIGGLMAAGASVNLQSPAVQAMNEELAKSAEISSQSRSVDEDLIGSGGSKSGEKESVFNTETDPKIKRKNCLQCTTSLVDAIENDGFVFPSTGYPFINNRGSIANALEYMTQQTGVTFGERSLGCLPSDGDYVVFTDIPGIKTGNYEIAKHVLFGRRKGGVTYFYDPQKGGKRFTKMNQAFVAYPIKYTR